MQKRKVFFVYLCRCFYVFSFLLFLPLFSYAQEEITLTTYYPAPYGVYTEMRAKRMAIGDNYVNTPQYCWSGTCTNTVNANADLIVEGNVGIGTATPANKLDVRGGVVIGAGAGFSGTAGPANGLIVQGLVALGKTNINTNIDSRAFRLDVANNVITNDVYLRSPTEGSARWASSCMGLGITVPNQTSCPRPPWSPSIDWPLFWPNPVTLVPSNVVVRNNRIAVEYSNAQPFFWFWATTKAVALRYYFGNGEWSNCLIVTGDGSEVVPGG